MSTKILITLTVAVLALMTPGTAWAAPTIEDFLRQPEVWDVKLSPDGTHLAMIINKDGVRTVVVRNVEDPKLPIIGGFSEDVVRPSSLYWGNNRRILIAMAVPWNISKVRKNRNKEDFDIDEYPMFSRMVAVDREMANMVILMEDERGLRSSASLSRVTNFLPDQVDHVLMTATRRDKRIQFKVNIVTGEAEPVATGKLRTFRFFNDADGNPLYRFDYLKRSKAIEILEYVGDDDWERIDKIYLNRDDEDAISTIGLLALNKDDLVYRRRNRTTGYYGLVLVDRATKARRMLVSLPDQDVRDIIPDRRTGQIVGYSVEDDFIRNVFFDDERQAQYEQIANQFPGYNLRLSGKAGASHKVLVQTWGADDATSYHLWDNRTQEITFLAHAFQGLAAEDLSRPAIATYTARDGQPIRAYILLPSDVDTTRANPTVVLPHGGPHSRSRPGFNAFAQFLSTRGYVVVEPNFRGSVGYGHDFEVAGYRQWGGIMQDDLTDAVNFMVEKGYTDPDKVCIVGGSYGGYAALMGAVKTPSLFKCAISFNGVTHLAKQIKYDMKNKIDEEDWDEVLFKRIGHPRDDRESLDRRSPALNAHKITIPVLIVAGVKDQVVPISQSRLLEKALKKTGTDYEFVVLEDTGHNPAHRKDTETFFAAVERFLAAHLEPRSDDNRVH